MDRLSLAFTYGSLECPTSISKDAGPGSSYDKCYNMPSFTHYNNSYVMGWKITLNNFFFYYEYNCTTKVDALDYPINGTAINQGIQQYCFKPNVTENMTILVTKYKSSSPALVPTVLGLLLLSSVF